MAKIGFEILQKLQGWTSISEMQTDFGPFTVMNIDKVQNRYMELYDFLIWNK